jgi:hypothetical protein
LKYERKVRALQVERAALEARAARANAMAHLMSRCFGLAAGLATTTWRWGRGALHRVRWTRPAPGKLYG